MIMYGCVALRQFPKYHKLFKQGEMALPDINQRIQSWLGHASHTDYESTY